MSLGRPLAFLLPLLCAAALVGCGDGGGEDSEDDAPAGEPAAAETPSAETPSEPAPDKPASASAGVLDESLPLLDGKEQDLSAYAGKVVLVVNTASECGFAPQFEGLEALYRERKDDGLVILGFPADDVVGQEPRSDAEIAEYCEANFGVTFPMFAKSNVVDEPVNPLYVSLSDALGEPTYNFNKYLLDRRGRPVEHFDQYVEPDDPALTSAIDKQL